MKRKTGRFLSIFLAAVMAMALSSGAMASAVFDYTADDSYGGNILSPDSTVYPGDRVYGSVNIYLGADNASAGSAESMNTDDSGVSYWENNSSAVYTVKDVTPDSQIQTVQVQQTDENGNPLYDENGNPVMTEVESEGGNAVPSYELDVKGYLVEAVGGSLSEGAGTCDTVSDLTIAASDGTLSQVTPKAVFYGEGSSVTLTADSAPEGRQFSSWKVLEIGSDGSLNEAGDVSALGLGLSADSLAESALSFTMARTDRVLVFCAQYEDTPQQSEDGGGTAQETGSAESESGNDASGQSDSDSGAADIVLPDSGTDETPESPLINIQFAGTDGYDVYQQFAYADGFTQSLSTLYTKDDGQVFDHWESDDTSGAVVFDDASSASTTVTIGFAPASDVTIRAVYANAPQTESPQTEVPQTDVPGGSVSVVNNDENATVSLTNASDGTGIEPGADVPEGSMVIATVQNASDSASSVSVYSEDGKSVEAGISTEGTTVQAAFTMPQGSAVVQVDAAQTPDVPAGYTVTVVNSTGASVAASVAGTEVQTDGGTFSAQAGQKIILTVSGDPSYQYSVSAVRNSDQSSVSAAAGGDGTYTIEAMPDSDVTVTISAQKIVYALSADLSGDRYAHAGFMDADGNEITEAAQGDIVYVWFKNTTASDAIALKDASGNAVTLYDGSGAAVTAVPVTDGISLSFTMPASDVTLSAVQSVLNQVTVTVASGVIDQNANGSGQYVAGEVFSLLADDAPSGKEFTGWTVTGNDAGAVSVDDTGSQTPTVTVASPLTQSADLLFTANYKDISYTLKVDGGSGSGTYPVSQAVSIKAGDAAAGYQFSGWSLVSGTGTFGDRGAAETTFTASSNAEIKANYELVPYKITVTNGSGSGTYTIGQTVNLEADFPASGKEFDKWAVTSGSIGIDNASDYYATATVKASDASVSAVYKDGPSAESCTITGLEDGKEYLKGSTLTFTAVGAGMDNADPNPGDYRYRPTGYQINSVTGSWSASPYTTSMAINAAGDYTLTVTYAKDVFDGGSWKADGTSVQKSITIHIVNALSVQTGDTNPIVPLAIMAAAALAVIIIVIAANRKRRR